MILVLSGRIFQPNWLESSAKSWQHCLGPSNTERAPHTGTDTHTPDRQLGGGGGGRLNCMYIECVSAKIISDPLIFAIQRPGALLNFN